MTTPDEATPAPQTRRDAAHSRDSERRGGFWIFLRDIAIIVVVAVLVAFLVKAFVVRSFYIPSGSMEDTLQVKDRILVDEITPRFGEYSRGDIVVFRDPGGWLPPQPVENRAPMVIGVEWVMSLVGLAAPDSDDHLIKRVIGMPGDEVKCCNALGQLTINDVPIDESTYLKLPPGARASDIDFDVVVPENSYWVMGDNRSQSQDSRYNVDGPTKGFVPRDNVVGRAFLITWPFSRFGALDFHHEVFLGVPSPTQ